MNGETKTIVSAQNLLIGAATVVVGLLGWIGSLLTNNVDANRADIHQIELSIVKIETRIATHTHTQTESDE